MAAADQLGPAGPIAAAIPGYECRPSQLQMTAAVEEVLEEDGVLLVEAGTGTGKTLAYLVPALRSGRRVVVSTGTKTLQDQIMQHDLPLLSAHLDVEVRAHCMKGLDNYLCLRRYQELLASPEARLPRIRKQLPLLEAFRLNTETGDRAGLDGIEEGSPLWGMVNSGVDTRVGSKCEHYESCFVTQMRRRADDAQLIVVNHHLFFADLATRGPHGGGVIPDYDAVVFDEAHQVEDVVTQFFGVGVSSTKLEVLCRDAARALVHGPHGAPARRLIDEIQRAGSAFFEALNRAVRADEAGRVSLPRELLGGEVEAAMHSLDNALEGLVAHADGRRGEHDQVAGIARRAGQIRDDIAVILEGGSRGQVTWLEGRGRRVSIGASPVDVSDLLREELFYKTRAVVLTSATLTTGGSFRFIKRRLGLDFDVREQTLASPFDYDRQAALYVAGHLPDPRDPGFASAAAEEILQLIELVGGGAFVLCTSVRAMRDFAERLRPRLELPSWVQGDAPKAVLLERFRAANDGVLFATASFWEGVDVPGHALRLVIMDKLPFDVPTDPLVSARCERLRQEGEQPFMRYLVPAAALTFKQGFGRLIRSRRDRGIVAVLDSRVARKGYGKVFLRSLPAARRIDDLTALGEFWRQSW